MIGGRTRARTYDPLIKSQLLYQLSYAPGLPTAGEAPSCDVRLAKADRGVQPRPGTANHSQIKQKSRRANPAACNPEQCLLRSWATFRSHRAAFGTTRATM